MADGLAPPQMVVNSRMLYTSWMPADPEAAAALLPAGGPPPAGPVYMNQYVVDRDEQTSGFGAYSLTYLGLDIADMFDPAGAIPARYMLFYFNSSPVMREYAERVYGLPGVPGATELSAANGTVVATTSLDGKPVIRTTASIGNDILMVARGQLTYVRELGGKMFAGNFPFIADLADGFSLTSVEFLDADHPVYALRPADPLDVVVGSCFYSPDDSFVYPGGIEEVTF
ncbi:MAG: hypothetical protein QOD86_2255 [Miltoncostaeaceae bacterium]|jgi:hypothetical protein|nr:hypothetical protein [Miltoncostaeaceae bacterium]